MITQPNSLGQADDQLLDDAEKLIWALLDEQIKAGDAERLESLIKENEQVRDRYLKCSQVHADLYSHYQMGTPAEGKVQSPVLGTLLGDLSLSPSDPASLTE
jgi:hypothetical protein